MFDSLAAVLLGMVAVAVAGLLLGAAAIEEPRSQSWPLWIVGCAGAWSLVFAASAVLVVAELRFATAGVLAAASEMAIAFVVWGLRCRRAAREDDDSGSDGGSGRRLGDPRPESPAGGDGIDWDLWERELAGVREPQHT